MTGTTNQSAHKVQSMTSLFFLKIFTLWLINQFRCFICLFNLQKRLMYWCTFLKCVKLNKVCFPPLFVLFITKGENDRSMQFGSTIRKLQIYSLQPHIFQQCPTTNFKSKMQWHKHAFLHLFQWSLQQLAWDHWKLFCISPW